MNILAIYKVAKMGKTALAAIETFVPLCIQWMIEIEAALPGQGQGELKLAQLRERTERAWLKYKKFKDHDFESVWSVAKPIIGKLVALFNKLGIGGFGK